MLPNRFPDAGEQPEYNAVDASLWFVVAAHELLERPARAASRWLRPTGSCCSTRDRPILAGYAPARASASAWTTTACSPPACPGVQLTWMDAKVGDWVVTPRIGKPVEVQALWLNALRIAAPSPESAR